MCQTRTPAALGASRSQCHNTRSFERPKHESAPDTHHRVPAMRRLVLCISPEARPVTTSVDNLRQIPLFSRLSDGDLQFLATKVDEINVPAGTALITEG